ncbi:WYL domain-containing protein [Amycolatopsis lexingtonensis]|uniref:WYL domain-containing protein n=1 Tax=Amycolatopsis lexingtonensis TaxID=218822 RepID=UPI003F6FE810
MVRDAVVPGDELFVRARDPGLESVVPAVFRRSRCTRRHPRPTTRRWQRAARRDPVRSTAPRSDRSRSWPDANAGSLAPIAAATWDQRGVRIRYLRWAEPNEITRTVEPHGLVLRAGNWYLVARGEDRFRTYQISRVLDVDVLPEHWETYLAHFDRRRHRGTAHLRLSAQGLGPLESAGAAEPDATGWTEVGIPIESVEAAVVRILRTMHRTYGL